MSGKNLKDKKILHRPGMERRPLEYLLVAGIILLIIVLLWSLSVLNSDKRLSNKTDGSIKAIEGTLEEINWLTESDILSEESIDESYDSKHAKVLYSVDTSARAVGETYSDKSLQDVSCATITEKTPEFNRKVDELRAGLAKEISEQSLELNSLAREQVAAITGLRVDSDADRSKSSELHVSKQTEENKVRARDFSAHVNSGVSTRRIAYENARATYQSTLQAMTKDKGAAVEKSAAELRKRASDRFALAISECSGSKNKDDVITDLKKYIASAKASYEESLKLQSESSSPIRQPIKIRKEAYEKARADFEKSLMNIKSGYSDLAS